MRQLKIFWTCLILLSNLATCKNAYADDAVSIEKGEKAPFSGILLPLDKAKELAVIKETADTNVKIIQSYKLSLDLQEDIIKRQDNKVKILLDQNDNLAKNLASARQVSDIERIVWVSIGIGTAVLAGHVISQAAK